MADDNLAYHPLRAFASQFDTVLKSHRPLLLTSQSVLSAAAFVSRDAQTKRGGDGLRRLRKDPLGRLMRANVGRRLLNDGLPAASALCCVLLAFVFVR